MFILFSKLIMHWRDIYSGSGGNGSAVGSLFCICLSNAFESMLYHSSVNFIGIYSVTIPQTNTTHNWLIEREQAEVWQRDMHICINPSPFIASTWIPSPSRPVMPSRRRANGGDASAPPPVQRKIKGRTRVIKTIGFIVTFVIRKCTHSPHF